MTRYRLSKLSGVSQAQLVQFVRGDRTITLNSAAKLAEVLGFELRPKKGDRLSTDLKIGYRKETSMEIDEILRLVVQPSDLWTWQALSERRDLPPKKPGLYGAWFKETTMPAPVPKGATTSKMAALGFSKEPQIYGLMAEICLSARKTRGGLPEGNGQESDSGRDSGAD